MKSSMGAGLAAILVLLAGCGDGDDAANQGVTAEESLALNETEDMLDASPDGLAAPEDVPLGNGEDSAGTPAQTGDLPVTDESAGNTQ